MWENPNLFKSKFVNNFLPDQLYTKLLDSKNTFFNLPSKKILSDGSIVEYTLQQHKIIPGEDYTIGTKFGYDTVETMPNDGIEYALHLQKYPEYVRTLDAIKTEVIKLTNLKPRLRSWYCLPNPNSVRFHHDYIEAEDYDRSKLVVCFLILSKDETAPGKFIASTSHSGPLRDNLGFSADVVSNTLFMHTQNLGHQYKKPANCTHSIDWISSVWAL